MPELSFVVTLQHNTAPHRTAQQISTCWRTCSIYLYMLCTLSTMEHKKHTLSVTLPISFTFSVCLSLPLADLRRICWEVTYGCVCLFYGVFFVVSRFAQVMRERANKRTLRFTELSILYGF